MFTRARLPGLWILGSVISPAEMEHLDDYYAALDSAGGTYALGAALILGGAGVTLSGTNHHLAGTLTIDNLGLLTAASGSKIKIDGTSNQDIEFTVAAGAATQTVKAGAVVDLYGALNVKANGLVTVESTGGVAVASGGEVLFQSGSLLQVDSGGQVDLSGELDVKSGGLLKVKASGTLNAESGSTATLAGTTTISGAATVSGTATFSGSSNWPLLSARTTTRRAFALIPLTYSTVSGGFGRAELFWTTSLSTNGPCAATDTATVSGSKSILQLLDLPIGGTLTEIDIVTQGSGGSGVTLPTYQLISWTNTAATGYSTHSAIVTDAHDSGNWLVSDLTTAVAVNGGGVTIAEGRNYGIRVTHPYDASGTQMTINQVLSSIDVTLMRI